MKPSLNILKKYTKKQGESMVHNAKYISVSPYALLTSSSAYLARKILSTSGTVKTTYVKTNLVETTSSAPCSYMLIYSSSMANGKYNLCSVIRITPVSILID